MTARKTTPRKATATAKPVPEETTSTTPAPAAPVDEQAAPEPAKPARAAKTKKAECNVPGCPRDPEIDGLCGGHWATHRGLATKE